MKTEKELVKDLSEGILDSFDELFYIYSGRIFRFALSFLKSEEDSKEIVQETFLRIWEERRRINPELSFSSWIFTIAYNKIISEFRKKVKEAKYREYILRQASADYDPEQELLQDEMLKNVQKIIERMPSRQKQIFTLRKDGHLPYNEIARKMGISSKTVENNINLAIKFIKSEISKSVLQLFLCFNLIF